MLRSILLEYILVNYQKTILFELRNIIDELINTDEEKYNLMGIDEYRLIQLEVQNNIISAVSNENL